jgi:hypothetical protein
MSLGHSCSRDSILWSKGTSDLMNLSRKTAEGGVMGRRAWFAFIYSLIIAVSGFEIGCAGTPSDFNSVILTASAHQVAAGGAVTITAVVPKDTTDAGVTWVFTPGAGAPANPGTFVSTIAQGTYTAPNSVTVMFTVTITATSIAYPTESASVTITVQPPQALRITTTTLPNAMLNVAYSATLQASGGVTPYMWTISSGSLPTGLSLASNGTITGTPTGTPGTSSFTVQVTDSETPAATQTANLSIAIANLLSGNYAFELSGFNSQGAVAVAGSFTADGAGHITNGVEDFNSIQGPPANQTFSGTYTLGSDNRGQLVFGSISGSPTYDFALDSTGVHARLIEFDSSGIRGSGELARQGVSTCGSTTLSGTNGENYVFGVTGSEGAFSGVTTADPVVLAGAFDALPPSGGTGSITGEADANIPGISIPSPIGTTNAPVLSGTFQTTSQGARCSMSLSPSQTSSSLNFSVYPVLGSSSALTEAYVIETDAVSETSPYLTVGKLIQQTGTFIGQTASNFFTATSVGALIGQIVDTNTTPNTYLPDVAIAEMTGTGGSSFNMSVIENQDGTILNYGGPFSANYGTLDSNGRVSTDLAQPFAPVFYIINVNEALCIGQINGNPFFGLFEPQSGAPYSASALNGTLIEGTLTPSTSEMPDWSGFLTLASTTSISGDISGTQDTSTLSGNTAAQSVSGAYSGLVPATGAGAVILTTVGSLNGSFFVVSPTKIVTVITSPSAPVVVVTGEQTDDFGVN